MIAVTVCPDGHVIYGCSQCSATWEFDYHTEQSDMANYPTFDEWNRVNLSELEVDHEFCLENDQE